MVCTVCLLVAGLQAAHADRIADLPPEPEGNCTAADQLVVLSGNALAPLLGTPVGQLSVLKVSSTGLTPVVFQVDRRDAQGRYIINQTAAASPGSAPLEFQDELVFRAADAGIRLSGATVFSKPGRLVAVKLGDTHGAGAKWVYVHVSRDAEPARYDAYIQYDPASDTVTGATYQLGFNRQLPFLVNTFRWKTDATDGWSPDVTDTMKIRHYGRFLGFIRFQRNQRDYTSRLVSVKIGPLRIIRRTENRIRVLWHLKTPAVYIDYVMMPTGFVMDTVIDIPFNVGLFFSDVETLTTIDWNADSALPALTIHALGYGKAAAVDGHMSSEKQAFNLLQSDQFAVSSALGRMLVSLEIPASVPITPWLYLRDAQQEADPPEKRVGQFGNVGFRTTGWEQIDTQVQHVQFTVCLETKE